VAAEVWEFDVPVSRERVLDDLAQPRNLFVANDKGPLVSLLLTPLITPLIKRRMRDKIAARA
jgi:hypothetical protein